MILVGQFDSPFVRRVAISLHMLGIPFERNPISVFSDAEQMRRINPLGRVPSLVLDSGEVLIDSVAILDHIDETVGPERALLPASGLARRKALQLVSLALGGNDKAVAIVVEQKLRPAQYTYPAWLERLQVQLAATLDSLERMPMTPFLMGNGPTQPDISVVAMLGYLHLRVPDAVPAGRYPALEALRERCEALPAFLATRPQANETIPSPAS